MKNIATGVMAAALIAAFSVPTQAALPIQVNKPSIKVTKPSVEIEK